LDKEHIIPFGLAGNALVLPAASCVKCAEITSKIETFVLQRQMIEMRTALGLPTRKKKNRPTKFELYTSSSGDGSFLDAVGQSVDVTPQDFPWAFNGLMMGPAGFLLGSPPFQPLPWEFFSTGPTVNRTEKKTRTHFEAVRVGQLNPYMFARFLAKIAHSYAFAHHARMEPMLLDLIFGKTDGSFRYWIGGDSTAQPRQDGKLHHVSLRTVTRGGSNYVLATIHLCRMLGTPVYHAVVGRVS
jgi:hypothetical protein